MTSPAQTETRQGKPWTEQEDMELLSRAKVYGIAAVAERLGRTAKAGYSRIATLKQDC
mgnify:CR=1 FL=1